MDFNEEQTAAYGSTRLRITDELSFILGARLNDWENKVTYEYYDGTPSDTSDRSETGVVTPFTGVVYDLNDTWSVYGSYTKIFNPQPYGVHDEKFKALDPQEGTGYELGVKGSFNDEKLNASLALFRIEQDNVAEVAGMVGSTTIYRAVEGITSPCGRVLGKMGHTERAGANVAKNIPGNKHQPLFQGGVDYFA